MDIMSLVSDKPQSIITLKKMTNMKVEDLALALLEASGGKLAVKDGEVMLRKNLRKAGGGAPRGAPRGPTPRVAPRLDLARETLFNLLANGPVTSTMIMDATKDQGVKYTDVLLVVSQELSKGTITESREGRSRTWLDPKKAHPQHPTVEAKKPAAHTRSPLPSSHAPTVKAGNGNSGNGEGQK